MLSRNLSPIYANLGIPLMQSAWGEAVGRSSAAYQFHWASHSVRESDKGIALEFDGETQRHDLRFQTGVDLGVGQGLKLSVNIPWIRQCGGSLDSLIDGWHSLWGFPDGPRPEQPQDRLRYFYGASPGFLLEDATSGLGDVELAASLHFSGGENWTLAAFAQAKLDTGDADDFTGSGDTGFSAGLRASRRACFWQRLSCHLQFGVSNVGDLRWAPEADSEVLFAGVSLAWSLSESLVLLGQLEGHEVVYASAPLDSNGAPLWGTLGLRWQATDHWQVNTQIAEDLAVGAAPDVTFTLGINRDF